MKTTSFAFAMVLASGLAACGTLSMNQPKLAANPPPSTLSSLSLKGEFTGEAHAQDDIGGMSVIFLKLRNDTDTPRSISSSRIVGVTQDDRKISPLSSRDAEHQASAANSSSAWTRAGAGMAVGAVGGAAIGGATGLIAGVPFGPPGMAAGAALFAAIGGGTGAVVGAISGALKSSPWDSKDGSAQAKTIFRGLGDQEIGRGSLGDGYVFLPKDNYTRVSLILSSETQGMQELRIPVAATK